MLSDFVEFVCLVLVGRVLVGGGLRLVALGASGVGNWLRGPSGVW